jgi:hypothetical protein
MIGQLKKQGRPASSDMKDNKSGNTGDLLLKMAVLRFATKIAHFRLFFCFR